MQYFDPQSASMRAERRRKRYLAGVSGNAFRVDSLVLHFSNLHYG